LFAPRNATVIAALLVCVLSVAGAAPFEGLVRVSADPLRFALSRLNQ
jgi:hypothetical protein